MIEHGISFGELHSFWDLDLILSSAEIPPASPKETYIEIPGADCSLDMTEAHGEVKYDDRTGAKFIFFMNPAGDLSDEAWEAKKKEVSNRLNGWRGNITLDKDPDYFWTGRCKLDEFASNKRLRKIVVGARLAPYKLKKELTSVSATLSEDPCVVTLKNARKTVCPTIICTGEATLTVNGGEHVLSEGTHKVLDIQLHEGETEVTVTGSGEVIFEYQEGDL
jgi:hypothetical protein